MTITTNAFGLINSYSDHTDAEQRIKNEIAQLHKRNYGAAISSEDFVDAALSGAEIPENPHHHNEKIREQKRNEAVRGEMLKAALKSLQARKQALIVEHADEALKYLGVELAALTDEVRVAAKILGNLRTAEQVLNADDAKVATTWKKRHELITRYNEIRTLQQAFTAPSLGDGQSFKIASVGHIRNSLEQSDFWLSRRRDSVSSRAANDQLSGVRNFDAWLGNGGDAPFKHSTSAMPAKDSNGNPANPWDYLVWLATKAEPWVPTITELTSAYDAANLAVTATDYAKYRAQEAGRDKYFNVIGRRPLVPYDKAPSNEKPEKRKVRQATWSQSAAQMMGL